MAAALIPALLIGAAGSVGTALIAKSAAPKPVAAQPVAQVSPRANSAVADALASRRGARENLRTGGGGAEAATGLKTKLGQ